MRFKQFLLNEDKRSKSITEDEAISLLNKHCRQAMNNFFVGHPIYRGLKNNNYYLWIDPSDFERKSANTKNYYTLLIDNSPYWKDYPKRSKSIICTMDNNTAIEYGHDYIVFPYDGAKIGICPQEDFWFGFDNKTIKEDLNSFNENLKKLFKINNIPLNDKSYKGIVKSFKEFDKKYKLQTLYFDEIDRFVTTHFIEWFKDYNGNLLDHLNKLFDPKKNGFKLQTVNKPIQCSYCEVWTDSKSILIDAKTAELLILGEDERIKL